MHRRLRPSHLVIVAGLLLQAACSREGSAQDVPDRAPDVARARRLAEERAWERLPADKRRRCVVSSITDGDTFRCSGSGRVRLLLVDAPERGQGAASRAATAGLRSLIAPGDRVMLELDVEERDRYGRTLAYVYRTDGVMVNEAMAWRGLVAPITYPPNVKHVERIRAAVADARSGKRGLWAAEAFTCPPRDYRAQRC